MKQLFTLIAILFLGTSIWAQDQIDFQGYNFYPASFNPAAIGLQQGGKVTLMNRKSYGDFDGGFSSALFGLEQRLAESPLALGLLLTNDKVAYDQRLNLGLQVSYKLVESEEQQLSIGAAMGIRSFAQDYFQATTNVPEIGLSDISERATNLDANLGLSYHYTSSAFSFFLDAATRQLPAAFTDTKLGGLGAEVPPQILVNSRFRFALGEQVALEPGAMLRLDAEPGDAAIKPGWSYLYLRAYLAMREAGDLWIAAGSTLRGGFQLGLGIELNQPQLDVYGLAGVHPHLGPGREVGGRFGWGNRPPEPTGCDITLFAENLKVLPLKPDNSVVSARFNLFGKPVIRYRFTDWDWDLYNLNDIADQASLVNHIAALIEETRECNQYSGLILEKINIIASLKDDASSLRNQEGVYYSGQTLRLDYQLLPDVNEETGNRVGPIQIVEGEVDQEKVLLLKMHQYQRAILSQIEARPEAELNIAPNVQQDERQGFVIELTFREEVN